MLTSRQKQVAAGVLRGLTNKEIATLLNISEKGVKFHLTNIYKHDNVKNRHQFLVKNMPEFIKFIKEEYERIQS